MHHHNKNNMDMNDQRKERLSDARANTHVENRREKHSTNAKQMCTKRNEQKRRKRSEKSDGAHCIILWPPLVGVYVFVFWFVD